MLLVSIVINTSAANLLRASSLSVIDSPFATADHTGHDTLHGVRRKPYDSVRKHPPQVLTRLVSFRTALRRALRDAQANVDIGSEVSFLKTNLQLRLGDARGFRDRVAISFRL